MDHRLKPFWIGSGFLLAFVAALQFLALYKTDWHFCYPLDDTFIHMAVAKNLVQYGVWGITSQEWVSTSSSPLFTVLLTSGFFLTGVNIMTPFIISLLGGLLIIYAMTRELKRYELRLGQKAACIIITLIIAVIPSLSMLGMEHTLQIAFTLWFVHKASDYLDSNHTARFWQVASAGALMVTTRYENMFMVLAVCGILFLQRRFVKSIGLALAVILPVVIFGIFFYLKGGFPIPNSILIKANQRYADYLPGYEALTSLAGSLGGLLTIAIILAYTKLRQNLYDRDFYLLAIFIISTLCHSLFGKFGWYFRYEAYLITFGVFTFLRMLLLSFNWKDWKRPANLIIGALFLILCWNLGLRVLNSLYRSSGAIHNIYGQQYQMGRFVKKYYEGKTVAVNDVGAVSFFARINTIDLVGLASNEVTRTRMKKQYNIQYLQRLVQEKNTDLIMMFESWFDPSLTEKWHKVATWQLPYNVIAGSKTVSFFALDQNRAAELKKQLMEFEPLLPKENKVQYFN